MNEKATAPEASAPEPDEKKDAPPRMRRSERREQALRDVLRTYIRDQFLYRFGTASPTEGDLPMTLHLRATPTQDWELQFDPPLEEQVQIRLEDALAEQDVYRKGHVYCFRCHSSACEHSRPTDPLSVFRGYTQTGIPDWVNLAQVFIDMKDERVDQLYATRPVSLAATQLGRELRDQQSALFGRSSKTYALLGQVVAGYFPIGPHRARKMRIDDRAAITFQLVEVRSSRTGMGIRLNVIPAGIDLDTLDDLLIAEWERTVGRALRPAQQAVADLEQSVRALRLAGKHAEIRRTMRRIPAILGQLKRTLEQGRRQQRRRTRHAEAHKPHARPVHKALEDARNADNTSLFRDEKRNTWIACGKQGRAHAFSDDGRHVTSFTLKPDSVRFRVRTRRWRPLNPDEITTFRKTLGSDGHTTAGSNETSRT